MDQASLRLPLLNVRSHVVSPVPGEKFDGLPDVDLLQFLFPRYATASAIFPRRAAPINDPNGSKRPESAVRATGLGYQPGTGDFFDRPWGAAIRRAPFYYRPQSSNTLTSGKR